MIKISSRSADSRTSGTGDLDDTLHLAYNTGIRRQIMNNTAFVTPISRKAKNRFANIMQGEHMCIIEQHTGARVFLTSANGRNHFWAHLDNDADWMVEL